MSRESTKGNQWTVEEQPFTIKYELLFSQNTCFEEYELWEYGIGCKLYDQQKNMISEAKVDHISEDKSYVTKLIALLAHHKVFPLHLYDVVSDQLVSLMDYSY